MHAQTRRGIDRKRDAQEAYPFASFPGFCASPTSAKRRSTRSAASTLLREVQLRSSCATDGNVLARGLPLPHEIRGPTSDTERLGKNTCAMWQELASSLDKTALVRNPSAAGSGTVTADEALCMQFVLVRFAFDDRTPLQLQLDNASYMMGTNIVRVLLKDHEVQTQHDALSVRLGRTHRLNVQHPLICHAVNNAGVVTQDVPAGQRPSFKQDASHWGRRSESILRGSQESPLKRARKEL